MTIIRSAVVAALMLMWPNVGSTAPSGLNRIEHIIVIYLENRSFDNLFGDFPGADGLNAARQSPRQIDSYGHEYSTLPPVDDHGQIDKRFPADLSNRPFDIGQYVGPDQRHPDLTHRFFIHQMQINGGRNDRFAELSSAGGLTQGYYDGSATRLWQYAREFTLADHFFQAAFGGSFLNHQWLICACTPTFADAPAPLKQWRHDPLSGKPLNDPSVTEDGYAVGTLQPFHPPFDNRQTDQRLPVQYRTTIGDRLSEKGIDWAWYAGGWNNALTGTPNTDNFQYHHQPFAYYANYAPGTPARAKHLKDQSEFMTALSGKFPQVAFIKPVGRKNQHPGYSSIIDADREVGDIVDAIRNSPIWPDTAIIISYDENGGFWDHVAPPRIDRWCPGSRVPAIIISPWAKKAFVDHTYYDTTSILKLIETRFGLAPLGLRDAQANDLQNAFDFEAD